MNPTLEEILNFIADFGIMVLISGIFLYVIIRLINLLFKYLDNKVRNKKHDKLLDVRKTVNEKVQYLIEQFLETHQGDRIHVVEFSNSVMSVAYLPFKYMNCTYEVYAMGKATTSGVIDRLSTSLFTSFFSQMYKDEYIILDEQNPDHKLGGAVYDLMHKGGERRALCAVIKTAKGKSLGYVAFKKDDEFSQHEVSDILVLADKLAALLGIMDN